MICFKRNKNPHHALAIGKYEDLDLESKVEIDFKKYNPTYTDYVESTHTSLYSYEDLYWTMDIPSHIPNNIGPFKTAQIEVFWNKLIGELKISYLNEDMKAVSSYIHNDHTIFSYYEVRDILLDEKFDLQSWTH